MENKFLNQAKQAMQSLPGMNQQDKEKELETIHQCIQSAYEQCSPEEQQELQQLEQELSDHR
ncbi:DUF3813 family protein [Halalkalibacillus halophilus]|uniref:DUF3813 family protein n=1 Tax=Halalkalibacillus halophilus TaxID=392827 RepID=UPI0003FE25CC|nr:DUF3813 family protein [Halalkalibacillus halophilus]